MKKILVLGGSGLVGSRFIELHKDKFKIDAPDKSEIDILDKDQLKKALEISKVGVVINFAAFTDVQGAETQKGDRNGSCYQINVIGAKNVADVCKDTNTNLIHISTDYVFDGEKSEAPYTEQDQPNPKNWYGQTKYLGERSVWESGANFTIVRISMPFSSHYDLKIDIARFFLKTLKDNLEIKAITDQKVTPVLVDDCANALYNIIEKKASGLYHVVASSWTTPFNFAVMIAQAFSLDTSLVKPISLKDYNKDKLVPPLKYSWLDPSKFVSEFGLGILHTAEESVKLFKQTVDPDIRYRRGL